MRNRRLTRSVATAALALTAGGGLLTTLAGVAHAAGAPPWETGGTGGTPTDTNEKGGLLFFNSAGQQITGGPISSLGAFVEGTTALRSGDTKATLFGFTPVNGQPPGAWTNEQLSLSTTYPVSAPANLASSGLPVVSGPTGNETLSTYIADVPNNDTSTTDGYAGLYQLRLFTSHSGAAATSTYDSADIAVSGTGSSATWSVVYPAPSTIATTTVVTTNASSLETPPNGSGSAVYSTTSVTLTATVSATGGSVPSGTVQFQNGSTNIGSPVTLSGGTATLSATLPVGTDTINAVFTPASAGTDSSGNTLLGFSGSNTSSSGSATVPVVQAPADATSVGLLVSPTSSAADTAVSITATVSDTTHSSIVPGSGSGSVSFYDDGSSDSTGDVTSSSLLLGTVPVTTGGQAVLTFGSFATGQHYIAAKFTPTDPTAFAGSTTTAGVLYTATAPAVTPDPQPLQVTVPAGSLTITTPYTATNPFNLGTAALDPSQGFFTASAQFGATSDTGSGYSGVTVTNTRAGDSGWNAYAQVTNFTQTGGTGVINAQNLAFTSVSPAYVSGDAISATNPITTTNVTSSSVYAPAATGQDGLATVPHLFASKAAAGGDTGTVGIYGTLTLRAPSSTPAGTYGAVLTFTAS